MYYCVSKKVGVNTTGKLQHESKTNPVHCLYTPQFDAKTLEHKWTTKLSTSTPYWDHVTNYVIYLGLQVFYSIIHVHYQASPLQ